MNNKMWVVVETYYKHGEYKLTILENDALKEFIYERLESLDRLYNDVDYDENDDILYLIDLIVRIGNHRVENQEGWGVREIRHLA